MWVIIWLPNETSLFKLKKKFYFLLEHSWLTMLYFKCIAKWFVYKYTCVHSFSNSFPIWVIEYWAEFPVLYRSLLVIYFISKLNFLKGEQEGSKEERFHWVNLRLTWEAFALVPFLVGWPFLWGLFPQSPCIQQVIRHFSNPGTPSTVPAPSPRQACLVLFTYVYCGAPSAQVPPAGCGSRSEPQESPTSSHSASISLTASSGACMGNVPRPTNLLGWLAMVAARSLFSSWHRSKVSWGLAWWRQARESTWFKKPTLDIYSAQHLL